MLKKSIVFLSLSLCFLFVQPVYANTIISFDATYLDDIAAFEATIMTVGVTIEGNFTGSFPVGWVDFSGEKLISAFDGASVTSLGTGVIGTFDVDGVVLGGWELTKQDNTVLVLDTDYFVNEVAGSYTITGVPIPGAIWLLGSALVGLVGIHSRRRKKS